MPASAAPLEFEFDLQIYRALFEASAVATALIDIETRLIVGANPAAARFYGYTPDQMRGMPLSQINTAPAEAIRARIAQVVAGQVARLEFQHRLASGELRDVEIYANAVQLQGRPMLVSILHDITQRRQAEAALRQSEERYRSVVTAMSEGVVMQAADGAIIAANQSAERILGLSRDQLLGRTSVDPRWRSVHADGTPFPGEEHPTMVTLRTGQPSAGVIMGVHKPDGALTWISINAEPLWRPDALQPYAVVATFTDITEQRRTQAALADRERLFRGIIEQSVDGIIVLDEAGRIIEYNPAVEAITGRPRAEALGQTLWDFYLGISPPELRTPEWRARVEAMILGALQTGQSQFLNQPLEVPFVRADGAVRLNQQRFFLIPGEGRRRLAGILRDITEERAAETETLAQRDFALSVMANMGQGLTVTGADGRFEYVNPAYARMTGYRPEDVIGRSPRDLTYPPDLPILEMAAARRRAGETTTYETRLVRADGQLMDVTITGVPRQRGGQFAGAIAVITDLSERKQAERAMADERARLRALVAASHDGILWVGHDQILYVVNALALTYLGLAGAPADWEGRPISEFVARLKEAGAELPPLNEAPGDQPAMEGEWTWQGRVLRWSDLPAGADQPPARGRLLVLHDVTAERQVEKLRVDLTRTMVHDLRNPLSNLRSALQMFTAAEAGNLTEAQLSMLALMEQTADSMLDLVTAILDVSRLESGRMPLQREVFSLADVLGHVVRQQAPLAAAGQLDLKLDMAPDLPPVDADADLIRRVAQNLLGNALKFTPRGGQVRVTARTAPGEVQVVVSDTGPGIPPELHSRLFQKFVTGRIPGHGSGLGLAFCRLAVEAHGGRIWADSEPGIGATFTFALPAA